MSGIRWFCGIVWPIIIPGRLSTCPLSYWRKIYFPSTKAHAKHINYYWRSHSVESKVLFRRKNSEMSIRFFNDSNLDVLCTVSRQFYASHAFLASLAVTSVLDCISLMGNVALVVSLIRLSTLHVNFRLLAVNMSFCSATISAYHLVRMLVTMGSTYANCELVTSALSCLGQELILGVCEGAVVSSMICITVERWYSTKSHSWYEHSGYKLGLFLLGLTWLESCLGIPLFFTSETHQSHVAYCLSSFVYNTNVLLVFLAVDLTLCAMATLAYLRLYAISKNQLADFTHRQAHMTLSSRMIFRRTAEITQSFLPSVILHGAIWSLMEVGTILVTCRLLNWTAVNEYIFGYLIQYSLISVFCAVHPFLVLWKSDRIREALKLLLKRSVGCHLNSVQPKQNLDSISSNAANINHLNVITGKCGDPHLEHHFQEMRDLWGYQTQFSWPKPSARQTQSQFLRIKELAEMKSKQAFIIIILAEFDCLSWDATVFWEL